MADLATSPYAQNPGGVQVKRLDYGKSAQLNETTSTMTYHGGSIVVNGAVIGRIQEWNSSGAYTREANHVYELNGNTWGLPVDLVPGRATGFNVSWTRNEVWTQELEVTLGYGAVWEVLTDQTYPFEANEYLFRGASPYRQWGYKGCWFTAKTPSAWSAAGDGIMQSSCEMMYVSRKRIA